jgi:hypothetical protein
MAVNAAGGSEAISLVLDLTGTGKVTFYWGNNPTGTVTVKNRVAGGLRMDSSLPGGQLTMMSNGKAGSRKELNGTTRKMQYGHAMNFVNFIFPIGHAANALKDLSADAISLGLEPYHDSGKQVYRVRVRKELAPGFGLDSILSKYTTRDILIDAVNFDVVGVQDNPYISGKLADKGPREIEFADYRVVQGVRIPFAISTVLESQKTLDIRLESVSLNTNIPDSDFEK